MVKATGDALLISLLRYGPAVIGSSAMDGVLGKEDTNVINVLARRVLGVNRTARLPVLHALSGMTSRKICILRIAR